MFCPVCGKEPQKEIEYMGAKVCSECGCVIELLPAKKVIPVYTGKRKLTVLLLSAISVFFMISYCFVIENAYSDFFKILRIASLLLICLMLIISKSPNRPPLSKKAISFALIVYIILYIINLISVISSNNNRTDRRSHYYIDLVFTLAAISFVFLLLFILTKKKPLAIFAIIISLLCIIPNFLKLLGIVKYGKRGIIPPIFYIDLEFLCLNHFAPFMIAISAYLLFSSQPEQDKKETM